MPTIALSAVHKRQIGSLILNAIIVVLELIGLWLSVHTHGASLFQFYTQDSNLLTLLACAVLTVYTARALKDGSKPVPAWAATLKYTAACCLAVTFVVVLFVLAPMEEGGYGVMLLQGSMLYHHLLCPVLALVSFIFLETDISLCRRPVVLAFIPTLLYAVVAVILNLLSLLDGPYPFLRIREQPAYMSLFWFAVIVGGACLLAWLVLLANRRVTAARVKKA